MNRRGVTPLVATFLLIGFSVSLGAIVMNWGKSYIEQQADFVKGGREDMIIPDICSGVEAKIVRLGAEPQICLDGSKLRVLVQNGVRQPIRDFHVRLLDHMGEIHTERNVLKEPLGVADAARMEIDIAGKLSDVRQAYLIPVVSRGGGARYCEEKSIVYEGIVPAC